MSTGVQARPPTISSSMARRHVGASPSKPSNVAPNDQSGLMGFALHTVILSGAANNINPSGARQPRWRARKLDGTPTADDVCLNSQMTGSRPHRTPTSLGSQNIANPYLVSLTPGSKKLAFGNERLSPAEDPGWRHRRAAYLPSHPPAPAAPDRRVRHCNDLISDDRSAAVGRLGRHAGGLGMGTRVPAGLLQTSAALRMDRRAMVQSISAR